MYGMPAEHAMTGSRSGHSPAAESGTGGRVAQSARLWNSSRFARQALPTMLRRTALFALFVAAVGCSSGKSSRKSSGKSSSKSARKSRGRRAKGPQSMGGLLVNAYVDDLKNGSPEKKVSAARKLAEMGSNAKAALPALQSLTSHANPQVASAAKSAIKAIND